MPIQRCTLPEGGQGWKWGDSGKCYAERSKAEAQAEAAYANGYAGDSAAGGVYGFDKSVRSYDKDGHLKVADSPISKAVVNEYYGYEIPEAAALGLIPDKKYRMLRDPEELAKSAKSFEGKPVMIIHRGATADSHPRSLVVGSVTAPVTWDGTYLRAPMSIWDREGIQGIQDGTQRELSSSYRYRADMTPGDYAGEPYDGVMRDIEGNHVALVDAGRAGSDVMVGDAALSPSWLLLHRKGNRTMAKAAVSRTALLASGALRAYLYPKMADGQSVDLAPIMKGITPKTWATDKALIVQRVTVATKGKLAEDADLADLPDVMGTVDQPALEEAKEPVVPATTRTAAQPNAGFPAGVGPNKDRLRGARDNTGAHAEPNPALDDTATMKARVQELLEGKLSPEDLAAVLAALDTPVAHAATDEADEETDVDLAGKETPITRAAMDKAIADAVRATQTATVKTMKDIAEAHRLVLPAVGQIAMDAQLPSDVYKAALEQLEVALDGLPAAAYKPLFTTTWAALSKVKEREAEADMRGSGGSAHVPVAYDHAADEDIRKRFPTFSMRQV